MHGVQELSMTADNPKAGPPSRKHAVQLIEVGYAQCRFIVSEPSAPALCCGAPTDGGSWCEWHRQVVYESSRQRVRPDRPAGAAA
jgi:hypothetical protein